MIKMAPRFMNGPRAKKRMTCTRGVEPEAARKELLTEEGAEGQGECFLSLGLLSTTSDKGQRAGGLFGQ